MKNKALMGLGIALLALTLTGCCQPCPPCPPTLETELAACQATATKAAGDGVATISKLEVELTACETTVTACCGPTDTVEPSDCVKRLVCPEAISAEHAIKYVGEIRTVQGKVVDGKFASGSGGQPTFLNLCYPYGDARRFTVLIWGEDRQEFIDCVGGLPEVILLNSEICVKGLIELYDGIPEIILTQCDQLTIIQ